MKKIIFFAILLANIIFIFGQNDSNYLLKSYLDKTPKEAISLMTDKVWELRSSAPQQALKIGKTAMLLSESSGEKENYPKLNNLIGVVYRNIGKQDSAIYYYNRAALAATEQKDSLQIAYALNNLGGIYRLQGFYPLGLNYMLKAIKIFEKFDNKSGIAFCAINIGIIYRHMELYSKALEYYNLCLKIRRKLNYTQGIALTLNHIAVIYSATEKFSKADSVLTEALKLYKQSKDIKGIASVYSAKANIYYKQSNLVLAKQFIQKALKIDKDIESLDSQIFDLSLIGKILLAKNERKWALEYFNEALDLARKTSTRKNEMEICKEISGIYELTGEKSKSLEYLKMYSNLKDEIFSERASQFLFEAQNNYEVSKKDIENKNLKENIEVQNIQKQYFLVLLLLVIVFATILYLRIKKVNEIKKKLEKANSTKDQFISILGHDLKNPFNATLGYTQLLLSDFKSFTDEEKIEMLERINDSSRKNLDLVENLLSWAILQRENIVIVPKELDLASIVKETVDVVKSMANYKNIELTNNFENKQVTCFADSYMIRTVVRNLITNSIKFTNSGGEITLDYKDKGEYISLEISDTGIGISKEIINSILNNNNGSSQKGTQGEKGTGLGMILCKEFVEKNGGTLKITSELNVGTTVEVLLPKTNKEKQESH